MRNCHCGHLEEDEHGGDEEFPGSTACNIEECECICFDWDGEPFDP